jgi:PhzF family phenazine biosynthesis protein
MRNRAFKQVDVFTAQAYLGNALAVVLDGQGLSDADMQRFARWTNLSETTFLQPPTEPAADYRVRIFTPGGELPFAGHPTLGSCHAWLEAGGQPQTAGRVVQQCAKGLIHITREAGTGASSASSFAGRLAFAAPLLQRSTPAAAELAEVTAALGITPAQVLAAQSLDNGPVWFSLLLDSPATVLQLSPDHAQLARLGVKVGVAGIYPEAADEGSDSPLIRRAPPGGARLCSGHRHQRRPGHRQPERQPGAMADRRRPAARPVHCLARPEHRPRRSGACAARRRRPSLGGR